MASGIYSIYHGQLFLGEFHVNSLGGHGFSVRCGPPSNIFSKSYCQYPDAFSEREAMDTFLAENGIDPDECFITPLNPGHIG